MRPDRAIGIALIICALGTVVGRMPADPAVNPELAELYKLRNAELRHLREDPGCDAALEYIAVLNAEIADAAR